MSVTTIVAGTPAVTGSPAKLVMPATIPGKRGCHEHCWTPTKAEMLVNIVEPATTEGYQYRCPYAETQFWARKPAFS
jgi:hypothetical protein